MSMVKKSKSAGEVIRVYVAYWAFGGFVAQLLSGSSLPNPQDALFVLVSLCVSVTFVFVYDSKERIRNSPLRLITLLILLLVLMLNLYKVFLEFYFNHVCIVAFAYVGVAFAYTYFFREKISMSPWKYLMAFFLLFLSMAFPLTALPDIRSYVPSNKQIAAKSRQNTVRDISIKQSSVIGLPRTNAMDRAH